MRVSPLLKPPTECLSWLRASLESQLSILTEKDIDPFLQIDINESDVVEATPEFLMIDSDHGDDEDIDI